MYLKRLTHDELISVGLSPSVARFITATKHPVRGFDILVRPVKSDWDYWVPDDTSNVIGLWDDNADPYCRWERNGKTEFVRLWHDARDVEFIADTEVGLLGDFFQRYWEFADWNDENAAHEQVRAFGDYIGFPATERLIKILDEYAEHDDSFRFDRDYRTLIADILGGASN